VTDPAGNGGSRISRSQLIAGLVLMLVFGLAVVGLIALVMFGRGDAGSAPRPGPTAGTGWLSTDQVRPAPEIALTDEQANPFSLAEVRGSPTLVFFGYTHCPDVCPATFGVVNQAMREAGGGVRVVFVSVDPERDTTEAMAQYVRYMPTGYTGLTGTPAEIRRVTDDWGVTYARIDTGSASGYAMAHTADLYLLDAEGRLRARFPFGTEEPPIVAALQELLAEAAAVPTPGPAPASPAATARPATAPPAATGTLQPVLVSTSVWSGGGSPVILSLFDQAGRRLDGSIPVRVRLVDGRGAPVGEGVEAVPVRPSGIAVTSYVATLDIPTPGRWRLEVTAAEGSSVLRGTTDIGVWDGGATPALGAPAPDARTPTITDVGGDPLLVTTQPQPDLRLSQTSTADARAAGQPYVLIVDSYAFQVSPACGRALLMARSMLDRWRDVAFIHLEPYRYEVVTYQPRIEGSIQDPRLTEIAAAWGLGPEPWTAFTVPWVFVVDGEGIVRAKYHGVFGSEDVDVILSLITGDGVLAAR
jgi:protein SCO1